MWINYLEKNEFLRSIYSKDPNLDQILIEKFVIKNNGLSSLINFDIQKPEKIPKEWVGKIFNTVHVELSIFGLERLSLSLEGSDNLFSKIFFEKENEKIKMTVVGFCNIELVCTSISVLNVSCCECELN